MYKKLIIILVISALVFTTAHYFKSTLLYQPAPPNYIKYQKFFCKISRLIESPVYLTNEHISSSDCIKLHMVSIKNPDSDRWIIMCGGSVGNLAMRFDMVKFLYSYGSVVIFDYRSYGLSTGTSESLCAKTQLIDCQTIWNKVRKWAPAHKISLVGEDIGCALALSLVANLSRTMDSSNYPHSVVLNSPFYSLEAMIRLKLKANIIGQIIALIFRNEYSSVADLAYLNHQTKLIFAHSRRNEVVPLKQCIDLWTSYSGTNAKFVAIGGTHYNIVLSDDYVYALAELWGRT